MRFAMPWRCAHAYAQCLRMAEARNPHRYSCDGLRPAAAGMNGVNPLYVLRNHVAEEAIRAAKTGDASVEITGDLTVLGVTKSVTIPFDYEGAATDPFGRSYQETLNLK